MYYLRMLITYNNLTRKERKPKTFRIDECRKYKEQEITNMHCNKQYCWSLLKSQLYFLGI